MYFFVLYEKDFLIVLDFKNETKL